MRDLGDASPLVQLAGAESLALHPITLDVTDDASVRSAVDLRSRAHWANRRPGQQRGDRPIRPDRAHRPRGPGRCARHEPHRRPPDCAGRAPDDACQGPRHDRQHQLRRRACRPVLLRVLCDGQVGARGGVGDAGPGGHGARHPGRAHRARVPRHTDARRRHPRHRHRSRLGVRRCRAPYGRPVRGQQADRRRPATGGRDRARGNHHSDAPVPLPVGVDADVFLSGRARWPTRTGSRWAGV